MSKRRSSKIIDEHSKKQKIDDDKITTTTEYFNTPDKVTNSLIKSITEYKNGVKHGKTIIYLRSGYIGGHIENTYNNGKQEGTSSMWDVDGRIIERSNYKDGMLHGNYISYYYTNKQSINGRSHWSGAYKNDKKVEKWIYYDVLTSKKSEIIRYNDEGEKDGYHEKWNKKGQIFSKVLWSNGNKISERIQYRPNPVLAGPSKLPEPESISSAFKDYIDKSTPVTGFGVPVTASGACIFGVPPPSEIRGFASFGTPPLKQVSEYTSLPSHFGEDLLKKASNTANSKYAFGPTSTQFSPKEPVLNRHTVTSNNKASHTFSFNNIIQDKNAISSQASDCIFGFSQPHK